MKIGIICSGWAFMGDLLQELRAYHTVQILKLPLSHTRIERFIRKLDLLYVEWCNNYMVPVTQIPKQCKIVNRIHRAEIHGEWVRKVDFSKVDLLFFVNEHMKSYCFKVAPDLKKAKKIKVVQLGVDVSKFKFNPLRGYGKRLGWVGQVRPVKDPLFMLRLMPQLPDWQLKFLAREGMCPDLNMQAQSLCGRNNIVWIRKGVPHKKMPEYYRGLDILVNTSLVEGQCVSILEAMSSGVYPVIRWWPHAEKLYPRQNLFETMVECKRKIWSWVKLSHTEKRAVSEEMRQFIVIHYNVKDSVRLMREAIENA